MKQPSNYVILGLSLAILISAYIIYDQGVDSKIKQHDSQMKIKAFENRGDSLERLSKLKSDSLEIAFATIRSLNEQTRRAHQETQRVKKYYENVIYVRFANDSLRERAIKDLYTSYGNR